MAAQSDRRPLVLLVDDDVRGSRLLARMLTDDGFATEVALDGAAALARLTRAPAPDALVTDYHLPLASGLAVARYARSLGRGMPVVMLTGDPDAFARATADDPLGGSLLVMTKPLDYGDLVDHLIGAVAVVAPA